MVPHAFDARWVPVAFLRLEMALRVTLVPWCFLFGWIHGYNRQ